MFHASIEEDDVAFHSETVEEGTSGQFYSEEATLCSFWDKGKKPVNVLSTMHGAQRDLQPCDGKSEIVTDYNNTKSGVDTLDKLVRMYSSERIYRRWPVHVFFTLVDCAIYVAYLMHRQAHESDESHYSFRKTLAYNLCIPLIQRRCRLPVLRQSVKNAMHTMNILDATASAPVVRRNVAQGRCAFCPRSKDKKSKTVCFCCNRFICAEHQNAVCASCVPR